MSQIITPADLVPQIQELYRPSLKGHWRRRVLNRLRLWLGRDDVFLCWEPQLEESQLGVVWLPLPTRTAAPRWLIIGGTLSPQAQALADMLVPHLSTVVQLMEVGPDNADVPQRWRERLTPRQLEVVLLAAGGESNEAVSKILGVAPRTVARLLQEAFRRLDATNRAALAAEFALGRPPTPFIHIPRE